MESNFKPNSKFGDKIVESVKSKPKVSWDTATEGKRNKEIVGTGSSGRPTGRYKNAEEAEGFTPKPFVSSRANKAQKRIEPNDFVPEKDIKSLVAPKNFEKSFKPENSAKETKNRSEYGPTMPSSQELHNNFEAEIPGSNEKSNEFLTELPNSNDIFVDSMVKEENNEVEKTDSFEEKPEIQVYESAEEISKTVAVHVFKPRASLKQSQQKALEKIEPDAQPLFSSVLSVQDIDRIKKVKGFIRAKDVNKTQIKVTKDIIPFKDDPIKHTRCYNFFCEMEGVEIGGMTPARLMTASEIRKEREEFIKCYNQWKTGEDYTQSESLQTISIQSLNPLSASNPPKSSSSSITLPIKRLPGSNSFEDFPQNSTNKRLTK